MLLVFIIKKQIIEKDNDVIVSKTTERYSNNKLTEEVIENYGNI